MGKPEKLNLIAASAVRSCQELRPLLPQYYQQIPADESESKPIEIGEGEIALDHYQRRVIDKNDEGYNAVSDPKDPSYDQFSVHDLSKHYFCYQANGEGGKDFFVFPPPPSKTQLQYQVVREGNELALQKRTLLDTSNKVAAAQSDLEKIKKSKEKSLESMLGNIGPGTSGIIGFLSIGFPFGFAIKALQLKSKEVILKIKNFATDLERLERGQELVAERRRAGKKCDPFEEEVKNLRSELHERAVPTLTAAALLGIGIIAYEGLAHFFSSDVSKEPNKQLPKELIQSYLPGDLESKSTSQLRELRNQIEKETVTTSNKQKEEDGLLSTVSAEISFLRGKKGNVEDSSISGKVAGFGAGVLGGGLIGFAWGVPIFEKAYKILPGLPFESVIQQLIKRSETSEAWEGMEKQAKQNMEDHLEELCPETEPESVAQGNRETSSVASPAAVPGTSIARISSAEGWSLTRAQSNRYWRNQLARHSRSPSAVSGEVAITQKHRMDSTNPFSAIVGGIGHLLGISSPNPNMTMMGAQSAPAVIGNPAPTLAPR